MSQKRLNHRKIGTVDNYRHFWLLSIWVVYLVLFFIIEHVVTDNYWVSYLPLDDKIPFCEYFIIPYCMWHPLLALMTAYLAFFDAGNFKRYMAFIGIGFLTTGIFCLLFPNGQDLRVTAFPRENFCSWLVRLVYAADTNTNVLPSMHVIGCGALIAACFHTPSLRKHHLHWVMLPLGLLISVSTVFVKQHSILDFIVAVPFTLLVHWLVYGVIFRARPSARKAHP